MGVMVVGGSGFVGCHVLRELLARGETPVSLDLAPLPEEMSQFQDRIKAVRADVLQVTELLRVIQENRIDRVVHLASLVTAASQQNPVLAYRLNIGGALNVLEAARLLDIKRIVYSSSLAVYGRTPEDQPVPEDYSKEPVSLYGATKLFCEHLGRAYYQTHGVDFVAVRLPAMWGPGQARMEGKSGAIGSGKFSNIVELPFRGQPVRIPGGDQKYELLYIKDARRLIVQALFAGELRHRAYNAGCETMIALQELADLVKRRLPQAAIEIEEGTDPAIPCQGYLDISRARAELGYEPRFKPHQALADFLADLS